MSTSPSSCMTKLPSSWCKLSKYLWRLGLKKWLKTLLQPIQHPPPPLNTLFFFLSLSLSIHAYLSMRLNALSDPKVHSARTAAYVGAKWGSWPGPPIWGGRRKEGKERERERERERDEIYTLQQRNQFEWRFTIARVQKHLWLTVQ